MRQRHPPSETDLIAQKQEVDRLRKLIREAQLSAEKVQRKPPRKKLVIGRANAKIVTPGIADD